MDAQDERDFEGWFSRNMDAQDERDFEEWFFSGIHNELCDHHYKKIVIEIIMKYARQAWFAALEKEEDL